MYCGNLKQIVWTQARLLLMEQSDLGPNCLHANLLFELNIAVEDIIRGQFLVISAGSPSVTVTVSSWDIHNISYFH